MKTINLINKDKSDVGYEIFNFPDGEKHIKLDEIDRKDSFLVKTRIKSGDDLFILAQIGDILQRSGVYFHIQIYYLMSMRMDRVMDFNEAFSLKVVADTINSMHANNVSIFHPHSDAVYRLFNNCVAFDEPRIGWGGKYDVIADKYIGSGQNCALCFPDAGAAKRYGKGDSNIIIMDKKRDYKNKGAIIGMRIVETKGDLFGITGECFFGDTILMQDDLCDGGRTFVEAAKVVKEKYSPKRMGIFVRHLVNSYGLENLSKNFDDVYITNSYADWDVSNYPNVTLINIVD